MNPNAPVTESINQRILELLGLEETFDLDYATYVQSLKERLLRVTAFGEKLSSEDFKLLKDELKRVKQKEKTRTFKIKPDKFVGKKKPEAKAKITPKKLLLPSSRALSKVTEVEDKSKAIQRLKSKEKEPIDILSRIDEKLSSILETLMSASKLQNKQLDLDRKERENKKRQEKESRLEKGGKLVGTAVQKILAPFQNIFERVWNFIKFTLLGRAFTMLMDWFADPKNKGKVQTIGRFLKDWWPALLGAYGLFMTPLGGLVRTVIGTVVKFTFQITKFAIPRLLSIVKANPLTSLIAATSVAGTLARTGEREKLKPELEKQRESVRKTEEDKNAPWYQKLGGFFAKQELTTGQQQQGIVAPVPGAMYASGGFVSGESGIDKVPAMLSDGEFVMSRGAVAKFGTPFLEALNAAGGGTNKPKLVSGTTYAYGGGPIGNKRDNGGNRRYGKDSINAIKKFIKYKLGYDIDKPQTWGPSFSKGIGQMGQGLASQGQGLAKGLANQGQGLLNQGQGLATQAQSYLTGDRLQKDVSTLMQSGTQFGAGLYDQALKVGNQALSSIQSGGIQKKAAEVAQGVQSLPKKAGIGIFDTFKKMGSSETYQKGAAKMAKAQDTMINLSDKFISKLPDGPFKDVADKGLIPIPSGNATTMRNLTFIKAMLGPIGKPFKILSNKEVDAMRQKTIEKTMGKSGLITDPKTGQVKMNWNQEDINKGAKGGGAYTDDLGPRGAHFNSILGRFSAKTKGKGDTLYTDDRYNFNKSVAEYAEMAKQGLMKGSMSDATYYGASMLGRFAQDIGWLNQRALGSEIEVGKIDRSKLDPKTGKMKSAQQVAAEKSKADKKKYGQSVTMYGANDPRKKQTGPYKSKFARPAQGKTSTPSKPASKPQRAWYDPRGWVGKQGGGFVDESFGMNIAGGGADRQLAALQPGEYILPVDVVNKLGSENLNKLVAAFDSNSTPAKLGYKSNNVPQITPYSQTSSSTTLPPIKGSSGGSGSTPTSPSSLPEFSIVPADGAAMRMANAKLLGIVG